MTPNPTNQEETYPMRRFAFLSAAAAVLAGVALSVAVASPASAAPTCKTTTTTEADRPDSSTGGTWAMDNLTRTVRICEDAAGHYTATATDTGSFVTVAGKSPNAGAGLAAGIRGAIKGGWSETFNAAPGFAGYAGAYDGKAFTGTDPGSSGAFVAADYGAPVSNQSGQLGWSWTYTTCSETWTNAYPSNDGDITGKACPKPPATPAPVVKSTTKGATHSGGNANAGGSTQTGQGNGQGNGQVPDAGVLPVPSSPEVTDSTQTTVPEVVPSSSESLVPLAGGFTSTPSTAGTDWLEVSGWSALALVAVAGALSVLVWRRRRNEEPAASGPVAQYSTGVAGSQPDTMTLPKVDPSSGRHTGDQS